MYSIHLAPVEISEGKKPFNFQEPCIKFPPVPIEDRKLKKTMLEQRTAQKAAACKDSKYKVTEFSPGQTVLSLQYFRK